MGWAWERLAFHAVNLPPTSLLPYLRAGVRQVRPHVGLCLELVHKHAARPLLRQACGHVDVVLGVGDGRRLDLDHFGPESSQEFHLFASLEGKREAH